MWIELLTSSAAQWIYAISGIAILIAVVYYAISKVRSEIKTPVVSKQEHLIEFDRMLQDGNLHPEEFKEVKKKLAPDILKQTKSSSS